MVIYKRGGDLNLRLPKDKSSKWQEPDTNPGPQECESDALTRSRRTRYLPVMQYFQSWFVFAPNTNSADALNVSVDVWKLFVVRVGNAGRVHKRSSPVDFFILSMKNYIL